MAAGSTGNAAGTLERRGREGPLRRRGRDGEAVREVEFDRAEERALSGTEGNDAANGIVGGDANGHAITRHHLDAEAAHAAAQLSKHLVAGVTLHAIEPPGVNGYDRSLHVNEIVFAQ